MSEPGPGAVDWDARPAPEELASLDEETVRRSLLAHLDELERSEPLDAEEIGRNGVALAMAGFSVIDGAVVAWAAKRPRPVRLLLASALLRGLWTPVRAGGPSAGALTAFLALGDAGSDTEQMRTLLALALVAAVESAAPELAVMAGDALRAVLAEPWAKDAPVLVERCRSALDSRPGWRRRPERRARGFTSQSPRGRSTGVYWRCFVAEISKPPSGRRKGLQPAVI